MDQQKEYSVEERIIYGLKAKRANVRREGDCEQCLSGRSILRERDTIIEELLIIIEKKGYIPSANEDSAIFDLKEFPISEDYVDLISEFMNPALLNKYLQENTNEKVYIWVDNNNHALLMSNAKLRGEVIEAVGDYFKYTNIHVRNYKNEMLTFIIKY